MGVHLKAFRVYTRKPIRCTPVRRLGVGVRAAWMYARGKRRCCPWPKDPISMAKRSMVYGHKIVLASLLYSSCATSK